MSSYCITTLTPLDQQCPVFFARDHTTQGCYLVDTGAEVSILPASAADARYLNHTAPLQAVNDMSIPTCGHQSLTLTLTLP